MADEQNAPRDVGDLREQAALVGVILIGVLTIAVAPGPYTLLSSVLGMALLLALVFFGSLKDSSRGHRFAVAAGVALCVVLITGIAVQGLYELVGSHPRVDSSYGVIAEYEQTETMWLGFWSSVIALLAFVGTSWLLVSKQGDNLRQRIVGRLGWLRDVPSRPPK